MRSWRVLADIESRENEVITPWSQMPNLIQLVQGTKQALPLYDPVHGSGPGEIVFLAVLPTAMIRSLIFFLIQSGAIDRAVGCFLPQTWTHRQHNFTMCDLARGVRTEKESFCHHALHHERSRVFWTTMAADSLVTLMHGVQRWRSGLDSSEVRLWTSKR